MYRQFGLLSITTNLINKQIIVEMNSDISPSSISGEDIRVFDCTANNYVAITYEVLGPRLIITLLNDPVSNGRYIVIFQDVENIVGEKLSKGIHNSIYFKSAIKSRVEIIKPSFAEKVNNFVLTLNEYIPDNETGEPVNRYYLEIATDNLFQNVVQTSILTEPETEIDIAPGQYFIRVRAQNSTEYGLWSDISTFVLTRETEPVEEEPDPGAIFLYPISMVSTPTLSYDGNSIIIEFDYPIDPDSTNNIVVTRRVL